jgi:hypothetical protein
MTLKRFILFIIMAFCFITEISNAETMKIEQTRVMNIVQQAKQYIKKKRGKKGDYPL